MDEGTAEEAAEGTQGTEEGAMEGTQGTEEGTAEETAEGTQEGTEDAAMDKGSEEFVGWFVFRTITFWSTSKVNPDSRGSIKEVYSHHVLRN